MRKQPVFLTFIAASASPAALAAAPLASGTPFTVAALAAVAGLAVSAHLWFGRRQLRQECADLQSRLVQSERTVSQMQAERLEYDAAIAGKDEALASSVQQHEQTQEMLRALREQVERVARIDGHTGVANHAQFLESLDEEIKRTVRQRKPLTLLFGDIDFFPDYVQINGRAKADHALQNIASCISRTFRRAGDVVARIGTSKFAVILPEADDETGERFAEKLRRGVYDMCVPFPGSDVADRITMSVGVVTVPPKRLHDRDYLIAMADNALLHAQAGGHNCVRHSAHAA